MKPTMKRKLSSIAVIAISMSVLSACETTVKTAIQEPISHTEAPQETDRVVHKTGEMAEAQTLYSFISSRLTGEYGVYTNLLDTDQKGEAATGHEILSESASLMMRYAVLTGNQALFGAEWEKAKKTFDMEGGFSYRFSPKLQKQYPVNAAVDDLRLIGALEEAGTAFKDEGYSQEAAKYGQRFYHYNVKDGYMYDFYDKKYNLTNKFVTLCYIDMSVLQKLSIPVEERAVLMHNMQEIQEQGYLSDSFPFYETRFDYETGSYKSENINTVESLLTILALSEVHLQKPASIRFIREQVEAGTLYGQYTREGTPVNDIRSTAIYAITAMIGAQLADDQLYRTSIERMNEFRVLDTGSVLYGGFGDTASGQAYSFDNLMALLAYTYE
ncbi:glycosyl hydrolase family 8 [Paenibacillus agri]|nr:glycosyl hydrolase family 8 [Paenibacillus agri]